MLILFLDDATYNVVLKKATVKSNDLETMKKMTVTCVPELSKGKTYSWSDVTCKVLSIFEYVQGGKTCVSIMGRQKN